MIKYYTIRKNRYVFSAIQVTSVMAAGIAIALLNAVYPLITAVLIAACIVFLNLIKKPVYGLLLLILIIPFTGTSLLNNQINSIPGFKIHNILSLLVILCFVLFAKQYAIKGSERVFIYGFIILFTISVIRSIPYIDTVFSQFWKDDYTTVSYLMSHFLKPILYFVSFILIVKYMREPDEIKKVLKAIQIAIFFLSIYILILYIFYIPDKTDFELVRQKFGSVLSMHGNNLADFFIIVFPFILLSLFRSKSLFSIANLILSVCCIGILYSRMAYLTVIIECILFFVISGRKKMLPFLAVLLAAAFLLMPSTITDRALTVITGKNMDYISAGRIEHIWMPLINEYLLQPSKVVAGGGLYAILTTDAFRNNLIIKVGHAHNMYLNMILDAGIIGLAFVLYFFIRYAVMFIKAGKSGNDIALNDILYASAVSVLAFMFRGFTDSFLFPALTNAFIWVVMGVGVSVTYLKAGTKTLHGKPPFIGG